MWRRPACQTLLKALDISGATPVKGTSNSIRHNCQKICSWLRGPIKIKSRFTFAENTVGNLPKVPRAKFLGSDGLFYASLSICKFGSFKNPFATIPSRSEFYFRFRRFILLAQTKKVISMSYGSSTSCWKPWRWVRFDLMLTVRDIHINPNLNLLTKYTSSSRSTEFKDILPWNISQMITKTISTSTRVVISYVMKQGVLFMSLLESQRKLRQ